MHFQPQALAFRYQNEHNKIIMTLLGWLIYGGTLWPLQFVDAVPV